MYLYVIMCEVNKSFTTDLVKETGRTTDGDAWQLAR